MPLTPAERSQRARLGILTRLATSDPRAMTANARKAANDRFVDAVDPDRLLPEEERARRADAARRAHMSALSLRAAIKRRKAREAGTEARKATTELRRLERNTGANPVAD